MAKQLSVLGLITLLAITVGVVTPGRPALASGAVASISAGARHTCALTTAGGVQCWGYNAYGQLGDGTTTNRNTPVDVSSLTSGVAAVSSGGLHTCALTTGGGVKCWGDNEYVHLGDGTTTNRNTPVDVSGLTSGVPAVSAGLFHTCVLTTGGGVKCWGSNVEGQLGDGQACGSFCATPVNVSGLTSGVVAVSAGGHHTCALTTGGGVKCWGDNSIGQLGDGTTTHRLTPVDVSGLTSGVAAVSAGDSHTCALTTGGGLKCWGQNSDGRLGDGTTTYRTTPVDVSSLTSGVAAVSAGVSNTCALTSAGGVNCWGRNDYGQVGDGTTTERHAPVGVTRLASGTAAVSEGSFHTCALTSAGGVRCWGYNGEGELGDDTTTQHLTPLGVVGLVDNFQQCDPPWGIQPYDGYTAAPNTICRWGCALTSAVDVLGYYGVLTTPAALNDWLKANGGYTGGHGVVWLRLPAYAATQGVQLASPSVYGNDPTRLQNELNQGHPVIVGVPFWGSHPGHWVVATGAAPGGTWYINDPGGVSGTTLSAYGNSIEKQVVFQLAGGSNARLTLRAHSPVEFVLTDPQGRRLGFDPQTSTAYSEIPDALYGVDGGIAAADGSGALEGFKTAWLNSPIDGNFTINIIGTGTGSYYIDGEATSQAGAVAPIAGPSGMTTPGQVDTATIYYTSQAGVGGIAELPQVDAAPLESAHSSPDAGVIAGIVAGVVSLGTALSAAGWYTRRRWARR